MPKNPTYTTADLATYLRIPKSRVIAIAKAVAQVRWNRKRTRTKPFTELEAMAVIARKRMGRL